MVASVAMAIFASEAPSALAPGTTASAALTQLLARSPGVRIGGTALKAKQRRARLSPVGAGAIPAIALPDSPTASVLGTAGVPEGAVPGFGPVGGFATDFSAPPVPGGLLGTAGSAPAIGFAVPRGGVIPILGGSGGGVGGGGGSSPGGTIPNPGETTPPGTGTSPPPAVIPSVPEPSTWMMLIAGFGVVGGALRRNRRAALA